jgi:hypothetical protein
MGFGYQQAREAGAPYDGGRSNSAINLGRLLAQFPNLRAKAAASLKDGKRPAAVLSQLRGDGDAGRYYVELFRGPTGEIWADEQWSDDAEALRRRIHSDLRVSVCKRARLWHLVPDAEEWVVLEEYPD